MHIPSKPDSGLNPLVRGLKNTAQILEASRRSIHGENPSVSGVSGLFKTGSPLHISRFIISVIVDALYAVDFRSWANMINKCLKGFSPFWANSNAPSSVIRVLRVPFVKASLDHGLPHAVLLGLVFSMCYHSCFSDASTGNLSTRFEMVVPYHNLTATITKAPASGFATSNEVFDYEKVGKTFSLNGFSDWHSIINLMSCNWRDEFNGLIPLSFFRGSI